MLGPTGLEKKKKKEGKKKGESWKWFGHSFSDVCVYTILVNEVVSSGIESCPQPGHFWGKITRWAGFYFDLHQTCL